MAVFWASDCETSPVRPAIIPFSLANFSKSGSVGGGRPVFFPRPDAGSPRRYMAPIALDSGPSACADRRKSSVFLSLAISRRMRSFKAGESSSFFAGLAFSVSFPFSASLASLDSFFASLGCSFFAALGSSLLFGSLLRFLGRFRLLPFRQRAGGAFCSGLGFLGLSFSVSLAAGFLA